MAPEITTGMAGSTDAAWEAAHWAQLQQLYHLAAAAAPGERTRILNEATQDTALMRRVLDLLGVAEDAPAAAPTMLDGRVGPYALLRVLGTGGMGVVFLAERVVGGAVQRCALKVLSLHAANPAMEARFLREQQMIATLDHPQITRLLDAGFTETGQAFLAMEFVDGVDLTAFCDAQRLSLPERLGIFDLICGAVAYAHRRLIVHLDLKPSNVLVTADGTVKLLDFGTSKLLQNEATFTTTVLATPAYASPEQMRNEPVTTACDIYALGVILFELLAGRRPFLDTSMIAMLDHALRGEEAPQLSAVQVDDAAESRGTTPAKLHAALRGDLTSIAARCLSSRPQDRYPSVDALREDVRRYRNGLPVLTRPQTTRYRFNKFLHRHKLPIAAGALAAAMVLTSLIYAGVRQHQALLAAKRAVQMQQFLGELFKLANMQSTGKPAATVPELLRLGTTLLPRVIRDPADQTAARLSLGESMLNDGSYADARILLQRTAQEAHAAGNLAMEAEAKGNASIAAYRLSDFAAAQSLSAEANRLAGSARVPLTVRLQVQEAYSMQRYEQDNLLETDLNAFRQTVLEAKHENVNPDALASAMLSLVQAEDKRPNISEQQELAMDALRIYQSEPWAVCGIANAASMLGFLRQQTNDLAGSVAMLRSAYQNYGQCEGADGHDTLETAGYLGLAMVATKQTREAIPLLESTVPRLRSIIGPDAMQLRGPMLALARSYLAEGQFQKSEQTAQDLVHLTEGKVNPLSAQMGAYQTVWARALAAQGRYPEALQHAELADHDYTGAQGLQPAARDNAVLTHAFLLELRSKVAAGQH